MTSAPTRISASVSWFRTPPAWPFIALRFVPLLAILNVIWEILQLPLYTIWREASTGVEIAVAVIHCTLGDLLIGVSTLLLALIVTRVGPLRTWPRGKISAITVVISVSYTAFSEWLNTTVLHAWAYSDLMPVVGPFGTGISPLLQWIVIPVITLALTLRTNDCVSRSLP